MGHVSETSAENLAVAFGQAAIGEQPWEVTLNGLAAVTGAHSAQLIGFGNNFFNWQTNIDPQDFIEFSRINGYNPSVNSRIRIGSRAVELQVLDESAFDTDGDMRRNPEYRGYIERADMHHICLTVLNRDSSGLIGLSVMRGARAGGIPSEEQRLFQASAHHARAAIRTFLALEGRAIALTAVGLEQVGMAAFVLDRCGTVRAVSEAGEQLIRRGDLRIRDTRLVQNRPEDRGLAEAISAALSVQHVGNAAMRPVIVHDALGIAYLLEILPLPRNGGTQREAGVLIIGKPPRATETAAAQMATALHGLTRAEAVVAGLLAAGHSPQEIAMQQGVGLGTVRSQLHSVLSKANMHSQVEFVADILSRL